MSDVELDVAIPAGMTGGISLPKSQVVFKLALIQMLVEGGRTEANLCRAVNFVNQAAANGAAVVLLPEAMNLGWTHPSAKHEAETILYADVELEPRPAQGDGWEKLWGGTITG